MARHGGLLAVGHPRRVLLISGAHAVNEFYSIALPPILPLLVADLDITYAEAGVLVTVFFVMYTVFQLPLGFVADRLSKRALIVAGNVGLAAGMLLASAAGDYATLVAAQVIAGIGGSAYHPSGMSLIADLETGTTEGKAMGLHSAGGVLGTLLAPVLIGGLAALYDWRLALGASAVVGLGYAVVFGLLFVTPTADETADDEPAGEDRGDDAIDGACDGDDAPDGPADPAAADAGPDRVAHDRDDPDVGLPTELVRAARRGVRVPLAAWVVGLVVAKFIFALQFGSVRTFTTSYIFAVTDQAEFLSNAVFFVLLAGGGVTAVWFGNLADRFDRGRLLAGSLLAAGVLIALTVALPPTPVVLFGWFFVVGGAVYASLPVVNTLTSQYSSQEFSGSLFGITQTASALGSAVGPVAFGVVATDLGMTVAFPAIAVVSLVGGLGFLLLAPRVFA